MRSSFAFFGGDQYVIVWTVEVGHVRVILYFCMCVLFLFDLHNCFYYIRSKNGSSQAHDKASCNNLKRKMEGPDCEYVRWKRERDFRERHARSIAKMAIKHRMSGAAAMTKKLKM